MKILMASYAWPGGTQSFCVRAFKELGHDVHEVKVPDIEQFRRKKIVWARLLYFSPLDRLVTEALWKQFNRSVREAVTSFKPDVFFTINERYLWPETLKFIKEKAHCPLICWIADNPFDSRRFTCFPVNLAHFTHLFVGEPLWIPNIRMIASPEVIEVLHGAADTDVFGPVEVSDEERRKYDSPVSFVGHGYVLAEGYYRGRILEAVVEYGLKIWGYGGWEGYYRYFPSLRSAYQGESTSLEQTNIVKQMSSIVLNIVNPQCFTAMQQRTFEIAAAGGFQLADQRSEIDKLFPGGEIAQFTSREDLRQKVRYYLDHPSERHKLTQSAREIVLTKYTYLHRMQEMLEFVR